MVASAFFLPLGTAVEEDCPDCLFARGKVSCDVEQLAGARGGL